MNGENGPTRIKEDEERIIHGSLGLLLFSSTFFRPKFDCGVNGAFRPASLCKRFEKMCPEKF